ncbi:uncharacterized protein LOC108905015 [Anoplophora glabripennis]|uniref:uncharacterized protein LOC108905015 n=1 Tax=Anoplophora glabripennis TaxID=217634 RepID=UPI0008752F54|nr:uncharacterized protein LOC108905015 [Anoplophora glabripennis]
MKRSKPSCSSRPSTPINNSSSNENSEDCIKTKKKYYQTYNRRWEEEADLRGWLKSSEKGSYFAYCHPCNVNINIKGGKLQLRRHAERVKHKQACRSKLKQKSLIDMIPTTGLETQLKNSELILSAFVVEHNLPIRRRKNRPLIYILVNLLFFTLPV